VAEAHIASNGFISLAVHGGHVEGALELAIRDGELAVGLDRNGDGRVSWGELQTAQAALERYLRDHLSLSRAERRLPRALGAVWAKDGVAGRYLWLPLNADCGASIERLRIDYRVLDQEDPSHRGLLTLRSDAGVQTAVLGGGGMMRPLLLGRPSAAAAFVE